MNTPIESPCVSVCQLGEDDGVGRGCFRTLTEIANWGRMSRDERRRIMRELPARERNYNNDAPV